MKILYILRGIPGCGKSTLAKTLSSAICEADEFFMSESGYNFDASKLGKAHEYCRNKCRSFMNDGVPKVVVSNTNTTSKEFAPYVEMAEEYGYQVFIITVENHHSGQNQHGVPQDVIEAMKKRLKGSITL